MSSNETSNDTQNPNAGNKRTSAVNQRRRCTRRSPSITQDTSLVAPKNRQNAMADHVPYNDPTTGGLITERYDRFLQDPEGFLSSVSQDVLGGVCERISVEAEQGQVELWAVCALLIRMEQLFESVARPKRWAIDRSIHRKQPPDGAFVVTGYAARYLSVKCNQIFKQSISNLLNFDALDGLVDALKPVLQPVLEAYLSGTLQLNEYSVEEGTAAIERQISKRRRV